MRMHSLERKHERSYNGEEEETENDKRGQCTINTKNLSFSNDFGSVVVGQSAKFQQSRRQVALVSRLIFVG